MATKSQLINFILEMFKEPDGNDIPKSKLDSFKKSELEEFIQNKGAEEDLKNWLASQQ